MKTVIKIENLGKKYMLRHEHQERRYTALRDVIMNSVKEAGRRLFKRGAVKNKDSTVEEFWALKNVSFDICQGDRIGIIGRNGAGKTTLLKILSRITEPSKGRVSSKGRVASLLEVGTGFHPELTGSENIYLNGAILGMSRVEIKKKFDEIVAFAEVERFLDTPVKRYSSGMYVRLAFAVAAHLESEILLVDEVLAVGDIVFQKKCLGKMSDLTKDGRTLLFVSHNIPMVRTLCPQAILLDRGKLAAQGEAASVIEQYLSDKNEIASAAVEFIPRPGANVSFTRAWITDDQGNLTVNVDVLKPFMIGLEFQVISLTANTEVTVVLENSLGVKVLFSSLSDGNNKEFAELKPGLRKTSVWLKANFLVPDRYVVRLYAHHPNTYVIDAREDALRFNVVETGSTMLRYGQGANNWCCVLGGTKWELNKK